MWAAMKFNIKKATKAQAKLRATIFGPAGSGKSYSSLRIATGLGGPIGAIDTERGSLSKYSDNFDFQVIDDLPDKTIDTYCGAMDAFAEAGVNVLVIDSLSHAWQELLEEVDRLAKAKYRGNTWSAWSEGTPKQRKLIDTILSFPGHVITTMRSKTEWVVEESGGKKSPKRVGTSPEQRSGMEYEFDLMIELTTEHVARVIKDRTGKFQDKIIEMPDERFGEDLAAWLGQGVSQHDLLRQRLESSGFTETTLIKMMADRKLSGPEVTQLTEVPEQAVTKLLSNWTYAEQLLPNYA